MGSLRAWLFRGLVIFGIGLLLLSWFLPWWGCNVDVLGTNDIVVVRPYGLEQHLGEFVGYIEGSEMPVWFAPIMWIYLGICVALLSYSLLVKEKVFRFGRFNLSLSELIITGVGISFVLAVIVATIAIAIRASDFYNAPLQGSIMIDMGAAGEGWTCNATTGFRVGFWLACAVGPFLVILALLRNRIMSKSKLDS